MECIRVPVRRIGVIGSGKGGMVLATSDDLSDFLANDSLQ